MAKNEKSFTPGDERAGRKPGAKNQRTKAKEAIGISNWNELKGFVENNGVQKCITELQKLKGKTYVYAYLSLTEYIKPKLTRVEYRDEGGNRIPFDFSQLPIDLRKQILEHVRTSNTTAS